MRRIFSLSLVLVIIFGVTVSAHAMLWDRGGGMIYDDVLNITWLQDANYAQTSGYHADGEMTWQEAVDWADQLSYGGYNDWRLPQTLPVNGTSYNIGVSRGYDGSKDNGFNISAPGSAYPGSTGSEMAYMYYNNLNNVPYFDFNGVPRPDWSEDKNVSFIDGNNNLVSFQNLQQITSEMFWSGTTASLGPIYAWAFYFFDGQQLYDGKADSLRVWAVRDGDVLKPITIDIKPATINVRKESQVSVSILSTTDFDPVNQIVRESLTFGLTGYENSLNYCATKSKDLNRDGVKDLLCYFDIFDAGFPCGENLGILNGSTVQGFPIKGSHSVTLIQCR